MFGSIEGPLSQDQYWMYRKNYADNASEYVLQHALDTKVDAFIETTGRTLGASKWVIGLAHQKGFDVMAAFPLVSLHNLISRCRSRKQAANCDDEVIRMDKVTSGENFPDLAPLVDSVQVYDNDGVQAYPIFTQSHGMTKLCTSSNILNEPELHKLKDYISNACRAEAGINGGFRKSRKTRSKRSKKTRNLKKTRKLHRRKASSRRRLAAYKKFK
jgi:hypothetical protein